MIHAHPHIETNQEDMVIGGRTILRKKFRPKTMLLVVKLSRTFLVTWLWWGGAHWIWRLQLFSPLHHNIIMHILHKGFSICFLKWWQGECASQSRESLVGDHFLYLCDLCLMQGYYCKEKFSVGHSKRSKG